ncbi:hypothetical protein HanPI659440_Chr11g0440051 [Helianthus annuus]|nr:hypothetical protein HanPI659440_Chr11g0440051 [Helianthus annuus]
MSFVEEVMMPWVGLYVAVASLICTIAMAADVVRAMWQWKFWFPTRFFTLNAATITLIGIAMKLPVDLGMELDYTKYMSIFFLVTMLANFLPSLGLMDDTELLMNITALAVLLITIVVNMGIQIYMLSYWPVAIPLILPILWPFSVALTVSTIRKGLEHRYEESQRLVSSDQGEMFSTEGLELYVKKYWMMAETHNPQFVIACSPVSSAFGVMCLILATILGFTFDINFRNTGYTYEDSGTAKYQWSLTIIFVVQSIGVAVGSIAPIFRCFTSVGHYSLSRKLSKNHLNVFRVEKHWIQRLQQWKRNHVHSHIPGRHLKIVFHYVKNSFLNFCIALHIVVLVTCKIICLVPRAFLILLSYCWKSFKFILKWFKNVVSTSNPNVSSEIEDYASYVVQIEEEEKLSKRILRNTLHSITQLLNKENEQRNLMMVLEKSKGFHGVLEFDSDPAQPLFRGETHNYCWSLVVVTLTAIAIALPRIANVHFNGLIAGMREGLEIVRHIEECLDANGELVNERKSARRVWKEVEVYRTWLHINLQKKTHEEKTSEEILTWLGEEAEKIMERFISSKKSIIEHSRDEFILASSMYRISNTLLMCSGEQEICLNGEALFERISTIIADVLFACFTNLPRVVKLKCHHNAIEKRGDNIRIAAQLLGKSKKIFEKLKERQLPNIDQDSMGKIDKWRVLSKSQIPDGGASLDKIQSSFQVAMDP